MTPAIHLMFQSADGAGHLLILKRQPDTVLIDGTKRSLPAQEFTLLWQLAYQPGQPVERKMLLQALWGSSSTFITRIVDVYIQRLRGHLPEVPIETAFRLGYMLLAVPLPTED